MSKKYDLLEYKFANKVVTEFPRIITILEKCRRDLKPYDGFVSVQAIINAIDESSESIFANMEYYSKIVNTKGIKSE